MRALSLIRDNSSLGYFSIDCFRLLFELNKAILLFIIFLLLVFLGSGDLATILGEIATIGVVLEILEQPLVAKRIGLGLRIVLSRIDLFGQIDRRLRRQISSLALTRLLRGLR